MSYEYICEGFNDDNRVTVKDGVVEHKFWAPPSGGYVRKESDEAGGCSGRQVAWKNGKAVEWDGKSSFLALIKKYMN